MEADNQLGGHGFCLQTSQRMKTAAVRQFAECNGHDQIATLLVKMQPQSLQLQAAAVLQGGCSVAEIRDQIPIACIEEMARNPCFKAFADYLGAPRITSSPPPTANGHVSHPSSQRSTRSTHSAHSSPMSRSQSNASAAAGTASISPTLECTRRSHEADFPQGDAPIKVPGFLVAFNKSCAYCPLGMPAVRVNSNSNSIQT